MHEAKTTAGPWPTFGWLGLGLLAVFWPLNWGLDGLRTHWGFLPLWVGYILIMEAWTFRRQGHSLLTRHPVGFLLLFVVSAPCWWLFELFNARTGYWRYTPVDSFSTLEYALLCTINFSVVTPALFSTANWMGTFHWVQRLSPGPVIGRRPGIRMLFFVLGWAMAAVVVLWPAYGAAFLWMSVFFILDPLNYRLNRPSLLRRTAEGNWQLVVQLWLGSLICGFFWELWNFYSSPKWVYDVPGVNFWHVFEMPLLGYLGYLPFALEVYALYAYLSGWLPERWRVEL